MWDTYASNNAILYALLIKKKKEKTYSYLRYLQYGLLKLQNPENKGGRGCMLNFSELSF